MESEIENLETVNVGIVGHIDHGKTTLLYKLTNKWTDTHSEELKRGITIKLGYSDAIIKEENGKYTTDQNSKGRKVKYITFIDAPGHEMLMATMLSGAAIIDAAVLVISANEGIKPQTKEHLVALKTKKIQNIIIVQNKIDLVTKEQAIENYKKIKEFLKGTVAENSPIIPISAQQGINLDKILEKLVKIKQKESEVKKEPMFLIARSFDINKPGTEIKELHAGILGGVLKQGTLKIGDIIEIKPGHSYKKGNEYKYKTVKTKIISIQKGKYKITKAMPGGSLSLETELDPFLTRADSLSGGIASLENKLPEITDTIKIKYELFKEVIGFEKKQVTENLKINELLMLSINTSTTVGQIIKIKDNILEIKLKIPIVPIKKTSIGIARNFNNHWRLIGFGEIEG